MGVFKEWCRDIIATDICIEKEQKESVSNYIEKTGYESFSKLQYDELFDNNLLSYDQIFSLMVSFRQISSKVERDAFEKFLFTLVIEEMTQKQKADFIDSFINSANFFLMVDHIVESLNIFDLDEDFLINDVPILAKKFENDYANGPIWRLVSKFCECYSDKAIIAYERIKISDEKVLIEIASNILGTHRAEGRKKGGGLSEWCALADKTVSIEHPKIYVSSWNAVIYAGEFQTDDFLLLKPYERTYFSEYVSLLSYGMKYFSADNRGGIYSMFFSLLEQACVYDLTELEKYKIISVFGYLREKRAAEFILKLLPFSHDSLDSWHVIDTVLSDLLNESEVKFREAFLTMVDKSAKQLTIAFTGSEKAILPQTIRTLEVKGIKRDLLIQLITSSARTTRILGLAILGVDEAPSTELDHIDVSLSVELAQLVFYELQLRNFSNEIHRAQLLCWLVEKCDENDVDFMSELFNECLLCSKDTAKFREYFKSICGDLKFLDELDKQLSFYFKGLEQVGNSDIAEMEVLGIVEADKIYARKFNESMETAREDSILKFITGDPVIIPFGENWAYIRENEIIESSIQSYGHSTEVPRMQIMHPEKMASRKQRASFKITEILNAK